MTASPDTALAVVRRRAAGRLRRLSIEHFARRTYRLRGDVPFISFTFDDFPRTAFTEGGRILADHGVRGTYFVSLKLLGADSPSGTIASIPDLKALLQAGHELGCHTYEHLDAANTTPAAIDRSLRANRAALLTHDLRTDFDTFAYPLNGPSLGVKRFIGTRFVGCRGGGQTYNRGTIDLNLLKAFFLDKRTRGRLDEIDRVIESNAKSRGWLIFATHDVATNPSDYGCEPGFFQRVVQSSLRSGATVLPMKRVCARLGLTT